MQQSARALLNARSLLTRKSPLVQSHAYSILTTNSSKLKVPSSTCLANSIIRVPAAWPIQTPRIEAARCLYRNGQTKGESTLDKAVADQKDKQAKAPWHREGSDMPPVARQRLAGAMTKGTKYNILT